METIIKVPRAVKLNSGKCAAMWEQHPLGQYSQKHSPFPLSIEGGDVWQWIFSGFWSNNMCPCSPPPLPKYSWKYLAKFSVGEIQLGPRTLLGPNHNKESMAFRKTSKGNSPATTYCTRMHLIYTWTAFCTHCWCRSMLAYANMIASVLTWTLQTASVYLWKQMGMRLPSFCVWLAFHKNCWTVAIVSRRKPVLWWWLQYITMHFSFF